MEHLVRTGRCEAEGWGQWGARGCYWLGQIIVKLIFKNEKNFRQDNSSVKFLGLQAGLLDQLCHIISLCLITGMSMTFSPSRQTDIVYSHWLRFRWRRVEPRPANRLGHAVFVWQVRSAVQSANLTTAAVARISSLWFLLARPPTLWERGGTNES